MENRKECRGSLGLRFFALAAAVCVLATWLAGCSGRQPGETRAEIGRRHDRIMRLDGEMMLSDLDKALLLDRPSRLTDRRLP